MKGPTTNFQFAALQTFAVEYLEHLHTSSYMINLEIAYIMQQDERNPLL